MDAVGQKPRSLSPLAAVHLAAPHTWPAAVCPVLLGVSLACAMEGRVHPWTALATLAIAVALQSAINTLNDYRDFVSGLDSMENCTDPTDAALVYENAAPEAVLRLGLGFLLCAAILGAILVWRYGVVLLLYGGWAALAIALYALPGRSASDLPVGEILSGFSMGGALPWAAFQIQTETFSPALLYLCLPNVLTVGCIMLANNTSDIEKDRQGGRQTLPVRIGRGRAQALLRGALVCSALLVALIVVIHYPKGIPALLAMMAALLVNPGLWECYRFPITPERRRNSMAAVLAAHTIISVSYVAAVLLHTLA